MLRRAVWCLWLGIVYSNVGCGGTAQEPAQAAPQAAAQTGPVLDGFPAPRIVNVSKVLDPGEVRVGLVLDSVPSAKLRNEDGTVRLLLSHADPIVRERVREGGRALGMRLVEVEPYTRLRVRLRQLDVVRRPDRYDAVIDGFIRLLGPEGETLYQGMFGANRPILRAPRHRRGLR